LSKGSLAGASGEDEAAADGRRFFESDFDAHAELEAFARLIADESVGRFVVDPALVAERGDGGEAVGLGFVETNEEAEAGDAGDAAFERVADAV
jgi:hypothetical protein